jgi:hypothetical protein
MSGLGGNYGESLRRQQAAFAPEIRMSPFRQSEPAGGFLEKPANEINH